MLPERGTIGYLTDIPSDQIFYHVGSSAAYYQTQYALVPLVVENSLTHEFIIGNFREDVPRELRISRIAELNIVRDFENGVLLLNRKP
jgi:hypothetical protein